jgi:hypothetical protein
MLTRIKIEAFRGFDSLAIEDFRRVNVFVGPNGGGKTSVLESLFLASQPFLPQALDSINRWRDMPPLNSQTWHTLLTVFREMDCHRTVLFEVDTADGSASLAITALLGREGTGESEFVPGTTTTNDPGSVNAGSEETVRGIKYLCKAVSGADVELTLELLAGGYQQTGQAKGSRPPQSPIPGGCFFIHTRRATSFGETAAALTDLYAKKSEGAFVNALRMVDPRIMRLIPGVQGKQPTILADLGQATLVPISVLGDGFCRVALITTGMVSTRRHGLVIVDEIDSGLHRTVMRGLWESLLAISIERDIQVFCSTHSEEMLQETLPAFAGEPDALRVFRISRNREGAVSQQRYDYEMLQDAQAMGMDVR